jgi:acetyl esterase/lipase
LQGRESFKVLWENGVRIPVGTDMTSYQTRAFAALLKVGIRSAWREEVASVPRIRERVAFMDAMFRAIPRRAVVAPVTADGVPCDWITADGANTGRVLLYLHGGGFSIHLPRLYTHFAADMSRRLRARVLLVDYRLAPEHPFPAAPQDCLAAYRWLLQQPGVYPTEVMIAGDSAGGNLTLVTLLMAKEAGLPPILLEAGGKEMLKQHPAMFARPARQAGTRAEDRIWDGMPHVFQLFPFIPEARLARRRASRFLLRHVGHALRANLATSNHDEGGNTCST